MSSLLPRTSGFSASDGSTEENAGLGDRAAGGRGKKGTENRKRTSVTTVACRSCQKRKTKCDGERPSCSQCETKKTIPCVYDLAKDERRTHLLRRNLTNAQEENEAFKVFVRAVAATSDGNAAVAAAQQIVRGGFRDLNTLTEQLVDIDAPSTVYECSMDSPFPGLTGFTESPEEELEDQDPTFSQRWEPRGPDEECFIIKRPAVSGISVDQ